MAATEEGQHQTVRELIVNNVKTVLVDVINRLNSNTGLDYSLYKVEWLCSLILRLGGMFEEELFPNLLQARHLILQMVNEDSFDDYSTTRAVIATGSKGRPKLDISRNQLEYYLEKGFKGADIAKMLRVSDKTVYRRLHEFGISVRASYSSMSEAELDAVIQDILHNFPNCGYKSVHGHLLSKGHKIQEERIREAMRRVDPEGNISMSRQ